LPTLNPDLGLCDLELAAEVELGDRRGSPWQTHLEAKVILALDRPLPFELPLLPAGRDGFSVDIDLGLVWPRGSRRSLWRRAAPWAAPTRITTKPKCRRLAFVPSDDPACW
jgi:hypothetical protein